MSSVLILFVITLFVFANAQKQPTVSETFSSNCTVYLTVEGFPVPCWITQSDDLKEFAFITVVPHGHHIFWNGGLFKQIITADKWYSVYPTLSGNPFCECFYGPYLEYWWWVKDSRHFPYSPPDKKLDCWYVTEQVEEAVCVDFGRESIPEREYKEIFGLFIDFISYPGYRDGLVNYTMLGMPQECASVKCI